MIKLSSYQKLKKQLKKSERAKNKYLNELLDIQRMARQTTGKLSGSGIVSKDTLVGNEEMPEFTISIEEFRDYVAQKRIH